jgi:hypothetical protein
MMNCYGKTLRATVMRHSVITASMKGAGQMRTMSRVFSVTLLSVMWLVSPSIAGAAQAHPDPGKFHADVAHALLDSEVALERIASFRVEQKMPPDRDALHEQAAHGFKKALELFGVQTKM